MTLRPIWLRLPEKVVLIGIEIISIPFFMTCITCGAIRGASEDARDFRDIV